jgi:hypothetical protein
MNLAFISKSTVLYCVFFTATNFCVAQHYAILLNGDSISGIRLSYDAPIAQNAYFSLDQNRWKANEVVRFSNNNGTFANLSNIHGADTERYAVRIKKGRANAYEEIPFGVYCDDTLRVSPGMKKLNKLLASGKQLDYYNMGNGPIYAANYTNMMRDFGSNSESAYYIEHHRKLHRLQIALLTAGLGIMSYEYFRQDNFEGTPIFALGAVISLAPLLQQSPKKEDIWIAFDEFNKPKIQTENP